MDKRIIYFTAIVFILTREVCGNHYRVIYTLEGMRTFFLGQPGNCAAACAPGPATGVCHYAKLAQFWCQNIDAPICVTLPGNQTTTYQNPCKFCTDYGTNPGAAILNCCKCGYTPSTRPPLIRLGAPQLGQNQTGTSIIDRIQSLFNRNAGNNTQPNPLFLNLLNKPVLPRSAPAQGQTPNPPPPPPLNNPAQQPQGQFPGQPQSQPQGQYPGQPQGPGVPQQPTYTRSVSHDRVAPYGPSQQPPPYNPNVPNQLPPYGPGTSYTPTPQGQYPNQVTPNPQAPSNMPYNPQGYPGTMANQYPQGSPQPQGSSQPPGLFGSAQNPNQPKKGLFNNLFHH